MTCYEDMAHMHNFARTRAIMWRRFHDWTATVTAGPRLQAAARPGMQRGRAGRQASRCYLVTLYPAASRSQVWGVTPRSRRTFFCGRPTRVLGRSSTNSTYRGTAKKGRFFTQ